MNKKNNILEITNELNQRVNDEPLKVLSEKDWNFWRQNGYVIIHNAIPKEYIDRTVDLIWEFEEKNPNDSSTWYTSSRREIKMKELINTGMVELYNHQYLWDNRTYEKVYNAFVDIWGTEHLWASIDRCNLNLPVKPGYEYKGFIHWDVNTSLNPIPVNVQGVLSLVDTDIEMGGFQCIPELYRNFDEWVKTQPEDRDPYKPDTTGFTPTKVVTKAGDLLIFNSMLAHGIRANRSTKPRLAQYISMFPAQEQDEPLRQLRIESWKERIPPKGDAFPGDPRNWEQEKYERATLTHLGEKLLGLKKW
ncbi:phytanoyl-CoA dioxygenase [Priestia megaterium]|uniref:phytanoyl-CoA dioxygenase family protein n=1 Tax=Priestia megaterium TaxID=1404 RepID=UPI0006F67BFC|nr:phytanoyl-CoA dioxygenase family protein [Priestia megaterium]KQU25116.1 phytanoyl-CoA dioxygenase [Bacillus sp. Leaf75]PFI66841.1 phytanoyl-CoA dioxygenase [Priestia megaterium]PGK60227.1 phytanoyl-CoA dioxygenase [Priestia megaterium]